MPGPARRAPRSTARLAARGRRAAPRRWERAAGSVRSSASARHALDGEPRLSHRLVALEREAVLVARDVELAPRLGECAELEMRDRQCRVQRHRLAERALGMVELAGGARDESL